MDNINLSDLAAVTNGGNMGGNWAWLLIILFFLGGNGFNRGGDFGQFASAASQNEILLGQKFSNLDNKIDRIGNGIADATYALSNTITTEGRNLQTQLANDTAKILDTMAQNKIETLQAKVNELQNTLAIQNAMCGIPKINPYMYGIQPNCGCNNV